MITAAVTFGAFIRWILGVALTVVPQDAGGTAGCWRDAGGISGVDTRRIALFIRQDLGPSRLLQHLGTTSEAADLNVSAADATTVMGTLDVRYRYRYEAQNCRLFSTHFAVAFSLLIKCVLM